MTSKLTKADYQRFDYQREAASASVLPSKAIPGKWYISEKWGRVLCCGTTGQDWFPAFAHRQDDGKFTIIIDSQEQMLYCRRKADSRSDVPGEQDLAQEYVFERVDFEW